MLRRTLIATVLVSAWFGASAIPAHAVEEFDKYAVKSVSASLSTTQAGAHADFTTTFELTEKDGEPHGLTRDLVVSLPPGLIGNPQRIPRCTVAQLGNNVESSECPFSSQVGVSKVTLGGDNAGTFTEPVYNMPPPGGDTVARFGLYAGLYPVLINIRVDSRDYSLKATIEGAPAAAALISATTTFWGVPASPVHDPLRLTPEEARELEFPPGGRPAGLPETPFLSNPTDCSTKREISVTATSYQLPQAPSTKTASFPQITGCGALTFTPQLSMVPTTTEAAAPAGLDVKLQIPQLEAPNTYASSALKSARVTLPVGLTINPSAGDGLEACSDDQVALGTDAAPRCPAASKLGSVEIEVPALERTLHGAVYQRTPAPGRLFGFWLVTDEQGVRLKLPAEIQANPFNGQLSTVFDGIPALGGLPQVPFSEMRLHIFGGPRAPLATPSVCGTYDTAYSFAPWSGKPPTVGSTPIQISSGCGKGGFSPKISAGTTDSFAGHFAPFTFTLTRQDGEANPQGLSVHLPQGLLAKLGGVPLCPDPATVSGACPAASRIGSISTAAGVGGAPLWIPQPGKAPTAAYLAGPYKGAPYSVVSVVPAQAGPFDLGTVVNRAAIHLDPATSLATITTDPLPQILEGVPISYRVINVLVDRPEFTLNPTSCAAKKISATVTSVGGQAVTVSDDFQATNCAKLAYSPNLSLRFKGVMKRTGNPAVSAVLTQKPKQANTKAATVLLPKSQFIDNAHISNPCTRVQFAVEACPKGSILGKVKAWTPLLDKPLQGKVYFRSNGGERELPDLVADLRGSVRILLVGFIDSVNGRVRTRFRNVPDAPVTRFKIDLFGGKRGLIENSRPLCKGTPRAELRFAAQNGRTLVAKPKILLDCGKRKRR